MHLGELNKARERAEWDVLWGAAEGWLHSSSVLWGWWGTGAGSPEKLWVPHPQQCSRLGWMRLWAIWSSVRFPFTGQGSWSWMVFKIPSNTNHSVILWCNHFLSQKNEKVVPGSCGVFFIDFYPFHFILWCLKKQRWWTCLWSHRIELHSSSQQVQKD